MAGFTGPGEVLNWEKKDRKEVLDMRLELLRQRIIQCIDAQSAHLQELALKLHVNPEIGGEEYFAQELLCSYAAQQGFNVSKGLAGVPTSFAATRQNGEGAKVAFLAEYDALPEVGHACGHNLIAMASTAAAVGLASVLDSVPGEVTLFGTPSEETNGAKVPMSAAGLFDAYDAALIVHPGGGTCVDAASLALDAIEFTFLGKPAHAAGAPHEGINALDAVISLFNNLNALRQHLTSDVRIHGIITEGGVAPNIVPERSVARFYFRAAERSYLNEVVEKAKSVAKGAALATGCRLEMRNFELSFDNLRSNRLLASTFRSHLEALGITDIEPPSDSKGSTDMGNVSHVAPAIHPSMRIGPKTLVSHTHEFCQAAASPEALAAMLTAAKAMALTGLDVLTNPDLRQQIRAEFLAGR